MKINSLPLSCVKPIDGNTNVMQCYGNGAMNRFEIDLFHSSHSYSL